MSFYTYCCIFFMESRCMAQTRTTGLYVCIKHHTPHHTPHTTQHIPHYTTEDLGAAFRSSFVRGALYFGLKNLAMFAFVNAVVVTWNLVLTFVFFFFTKMDSSSSTEWSICGRYSGVDNVLCRVRHNPLYFLFYDSNFATYIARFIFITVIVFF